MRLDHLLSKEHAPERVGRRGRPGGVVFASGVIDDSAPDVGVAASVPLVSAGFRWVGVGNLVVVSAGGCLAHCWALRNQACSGLSGPAAGLVLVGGACCLVFE